MNSTFDMTGPELSASNEGEPAEDWSEIWALEDPSISGSLPADDRAEERPRSLQ